MCLRYESVESRWTLGHEEKGYAFTKDYGMVHIKQIISDKL